ncbi:hypothetical protein CPC16_005687, partial [Podila verticillata]
FKQQQQATLPSLMEANYNLHQHRRHNPNHVQSNHRISDILNGSTHLSLPLPTISTSNNNNNINNNGNVGSDYDRKLPPISSLLPIF